MVEKRRSREAEQRESGIYLGQQGVCIVVHFFDEKEQNPA